MVFSHLCYIWQHDTMTKCTFLFASDYHTSPAPYLNLPVIKDASSYAIPISVVWADLQKATPRRTTLGSLALLICSRELQYFLHLKRRWSLSFPAAFLKIMLMLCRRSKSILLFIRPSTDHRLKRWLPLSIDDYTWTLRAETQARAACSHQLSVRIGRHTDSHLQNNLPNLL